MHIDHVRVLLLVLLVEPDRLFDALDVVVLEFRKYVKRDALKRMDGAASQELLRGEDVRSLDVMLKLILVVVEYEVSDLQQPTVDCIDRRVDTVGRLLHTTLPLEHFQIAEYEVLAENRLHEFFGESIDDLSCVVTHVDCEYIKLPSL